MGPEHQDDRETNQALKNVLKAGQKFFLKTQGSGQGVKSAKALNWKGVLSTSSLVQPVQKLD
jgi:hypothetical protein